MRTRNYTFLQLENHLYSKPVKGLQGYEVGYGFAFNGKEKDNDGMGGGGSTYDYGFRIYNPNLGRFLSVDPLTKSYPFYTPYQFAGNKPIWAIDLDGLEEYKMTEVEGKKVLTITAKYGIITEGDNALKNPDIKQINDDLNKKWGGVHEVELTRRVAKKLGVEKNKDGKSIISVQFNIEVVDIKDGANFDVSGTNNPNAGIISSQSSESVKKYAPENVNAPGITLGRLGDVNSYDIWLN